MWEVGFKRYLKEVLNAFLGRISSTWNNGNVSLELSDKGDTVLIKLKEGEQEYQEELLYEEFYKILVPDGKSLKYLYMFQDILDEINEESSKQVVIHSFLDELIQKMYPDISKRKSIMEKIEEEQIKLIPGKKFRIGDTQFEQLELAI